MVKSAQRQPSLTRRQKQADTLGIDIGIHNYLSLSDGSTVIQLPPLLQRNIKRSKNLRKSWPGAKRDPTAVESSSPRSNASTTS